MCTDVHTCASMRNSCTLHLQPFSQPSTTMRLSCPFKFSPEEHFFQRITCIGKPGVVGWSPCCQRPVETSPLQRQWQQRPQLSLGLCYTLQPYLCLPRQRPQHLWCLLLLRLFLEHVLQRLQICSEQDTTKVSPHRRQSERGEQSGAGYRAGPPSRLPTCILNSHAEVGRACHSTDGQKINYASSVKTGDS